MRLLQLRSQDLRAIFRWKSLQTEQQKKLQAVSHCTDDTLRHSDSEQLNVPTFFETQDSVVLERQRKVIGTLVKMMDDT